MRSPAGGAVAACASVCQPTARHGGAMSVLGAQNKTPPIRLWTELQGSNRRNQEDAAMMMTLQPIIIIFLVAGYLLTTETLRFSPSVST